jgi:hypothetical protein
MGMSPYKMVYRKACHLPLELEHKAFWEVKDLNRDFKLTDKKKLLDLSSLDEWRNEAYKNARLFKEKVKQWHNKRILKREFHVGEKVLLYRCNIPARRTTPGQNRGVLCTSSETTGFFCAFITKT